MPELPEVETLRADLQHEIAGHAVVRADVPQARMTRGQGIDEIVSRTSGQRIRSVGRRGKFLLLQLESEDTLLLHRGMSGNLFLESQADPGAKHRHLSLELDDGRLLTLYDPRGFGVIQVLDASALTGRLASLGPEPLGPEFTVAYLADRWAKRTASVKPLLLNQSTVAGLGNIYTDESLWAAELHPTRPAGTLSTEEIERLHGQIRATLSDAIEHRGTTFSDALDLYKQPGTYQYHLRIFHRPACPRCNGPIQQTQIANRGTSICPTCQR